MRYFLLFFYLLLMGFSPNIANAAVAQKNYSSPIQPKTIIKASKKAKKGKKVDPYVIMGVICGALTIVAGAFARLPVIWIMGIVLFTISLAGLIWLLI